MEVYTISRLDSTYGATVSGQQHIIVPCREEGKLQIRTPLCCLSVLAGAAAQIAMGQNDWPAYGRDPGAQRYSPLKQISTGNVSKLIQAWTVQTKPESDTKGKRTSGATALMVNDVLYFATPYQSVVAVEPETGRRLWI
jgi:glucose dehydrogenase